MITEGAIKQTEEFIDLYRETKPGIQNEVEATAVNLQLQLEIIKLLKSINDKLDAGIKNAKRLRNPCFHNSLNSGY